MERPNHLKVEEKSAASKATSVAIVIAIHVAGIAGLIAALAQGALMKQLQEIKATVDTQKIAAQGAAAAAAGSGEAAAAGRHRSGIPGRHGAAAAGHHRAPSRRRPPPPPKAAPVAASDPLRPIMRTHTLPPYPPISVRLNEAGTTLMEVHITVEGNVDECKIVTTSQLGAPGHGRLRLCQARLALAAAHPAGYAPRRFDPGLRQMGPQGREVITASINVNSSDYLRSRKMNFKKLTIAAAIVAMTSLSAVAPVFAQAAPAAPAAAPADRLPLRLRRLRRRRCACRRRPATMPPPPRSTPPTQSTPYGLQHMWRKRWLDLPQPS